MSIFSSCSLLSGFTPTCLPFAPSPPDRLLSLYHIRSLIRTHRVCIFQNLTVFHIFISFHIFIYSFIIITIIIMDFHSAYILRNKTESLSIIAKSYYCQKGPPKIYCGNTRWNRYVSSFLRKVPIVSDVLKLMESSFHALGAATENARLPKFDLVLGTR